MELKVFEQADYDVLKALFKDVFTKEPWLDQWDDDNQLDAYIKDLVMNSNSLTLMLVDDHGKIVAGSMGYTFHWWQGSDYYIKEFFVDHNRQGEGLGGQFINMIEEYLKDHNLKAMWLMTERNYPAYDFYKKNGFGTMTDTKVMAKSVD